MLRFQYSLVSLLLQMKSVFKRWLDYEMEHGTSDRAKAVQDAARSYVEQHMDG